MELEMVCHRRRSLPTACDSDDDSHRFWVEVDSSNTLNKATNKYSGLSSCTWSVKGSMLYNDILWAEKSQAKSFSTIV